MPLKQFISLWVLFIGVLICTPVLASQFYVFAVSELEGVSNSVPAERRPLIDTRVRAIFTAKLQSEILEYFTSRIAAVYPSSVVHAKQISAATSTRPYSYHKDGVQCGEGFAAPVQQSYAAVLGLTRASWYQTTKERGVQELLVPITINLQLIKPDKGKVAFSISETLYTPFRFGSVDELNGSSGIIQDEIRKGVYQQIEDLVSRMSKGFQPKDVVAKVLAETKGVMIVDKGYESGFVVGDEPIATHATTKTVNLFSVESVSSGYSVIKKLQGDAKTGDQLIFTVEAAADDSAKPRAMPVYPFTDPSKSAIAEYFTKDIGFSARFQISTVDTNFKDSQDTIERQANCVPWGQFEAMRKDFDSRKDAPNYFLTFDYAFSPILKEAGYGGLETAETWITTVSASLVDRLGRVIFSDIGQDRYKLEKKAGKGFDINQAREVSLKNASVHVAKKFIDRVNFEPKEFEITSASKDRYNVKGLSLSADTTINASVVRPLSFRINGKEALWLLRLDHNSDWEQNGDTVEFRYSSASTKVESGDKFRASGLNSPKQKNFHECNEHFVGTGSIKADHLLPVIRNNLLASERFLITITNPSFYETANYFLKEGKFKLQLYPPKQDKECVKIGYSVKPDQPRCEKGKCSVEFLAASTIIVERSGQRIANYVQAETITLTGFQQDSDFAAVGYRAAESVLQNGAKLTGKLNQGK